MSVISLPFTSGGRAPSRPGPKLWTEQEFDRLVQLGMFDGKKVELIEGELLEVPPMNDSHAQAVQLTQYALLPIFPGSSFTIRVQLPMRLASGSRPMPDIAVVPGTPRDVATHPNGAVLLIEISDTTLDFDRTEKAQLYARNGIEDYWIVNLAGRTVEVRRQPAQTSSGAFEYRLTQSYYPGDALAPLVRPDQPIRVDDLLPSESRG